MIINKRKSFFLLILLMIILMCSSIFVNAFSLFGPITPPPQTFIINYTVNGTVNGTTYTAGVGLNLTGTIFSFNETYGDIRYLKLDTTNNPLLNSLIINGNITTYNIYPNLSLTYDIGSGPLRWRYLYVGNISADEIDVSGDIIANEFYGSGAYLDNLNVTTNLILNGTNITDIFVLKTGDTMTGPLLNTDGTYTVTINGTTISSNTAYNPLIRLGIGSIADSSYSIAMGLDAHSHATSGVAIGAGASASGIEGMAFAAWSTAGYRANSLGYASSANGDYSFTGGYASAAYGDNSVAIGNQPRALGDYSLAMGSHSKAVGMYSTSIGVNTNASGYMSYAFGDNVTVSGNRSYGFGEDGISTRDNTFTLHNLDLVVDGNATADHFIVGGLVRAGVGTCASGEFVQNTTESGVECLSVLSTTYYLNSSAVTGGSYTDSSDVEDAWYYDGVSLNFTEGNGVDPLDIYLNFTGVVDFSQLVMKEYYIGSASHTIQVEIWDYDDSTWESYFAFVGQTGMTQLSIPVYDSAEHINNSIVQVRLHHIQNGVASHRLYIDFIWLVDGSDVGSSTNLAGYAKYSFGYNDFVGNGYFNTTGDVCVNGLCLSSVATSGGLWTNTSGTAEYDGDVNITGNLHVQSVIQNDSGIFKDGVQVIDWSGISGP